MAMYNKLLRATAVVVPLAARRAAVSSSSRTFHSALSVKLLLHKETTPFVPSRSFSDAVAKEPVADDNLVQLLQTQIDDNILKQVKMSEEFPFEVEDNPGETTTIIKRQYEDETITVNIKIPYRHRQYIPLNLDVIIFKGDGESLEFDLTAYPDEIEINSFKINKPQVSEDESEVDSEDSEDEAERLEYEGPKFSDLDKNVQKAFHKYLEIRGIKPGTTKFLKECIFSKKNKENLVRLQNLKSFIEKKN